MTKELKLRPEYIEKALKIHEQPSIKIGSIKNFKKKYKIKDIQNETI